MDNILINFHCGKCRKYWNIIKGREINDKRCRRCKCRICEKCYDDTESCLQCEIFFLKVRIRSLNESVSYYKLILKELIDKYKDDVDSDTLEGANIYNSDDE